MFTDTSVGTKLVTDNTTDISQRAAAVIAGAGILLMVIPPIFAGSVVSGALVPGDAVATAQNILANEMQFRLAILSFLVVIVLDVIVSWGLYLFFKPVNRSLSLLAAWFRLLYTAVFAVAILNLGNALYFLQSVGAMASLGTEQLQGQALLALNAFNNSWDFGLALFGLHLILVGYLVFKAGYMPWILGALVVLCGLGYTFDSVVGILFPDFGVTVSLVTFVGELLLALWLVIKGLSDKQWEKVALESA
jgi:hypothetical protein